MFVSFSESSGNSKISGTGKVAATYVPTNVTCPSCPLKGQGCYAEAGRVGMINYRLNRESENLSSLDVARLEARAIRAAFKGGPIPQDGVKGGRDLRLHVSGDVRTRKGLALLASSFRDWIKRGGGSIWAYTHSWNTLPRKSWGPASVLASITDPKDTKKVRKQGYAPAIVVERHPGDHAFYLPGCDTKWIPCPQQTRGIPCTDCRLCMDADRLYKDKRGIAFEAHSTTNKIKPALVVLHKKEK